MRALGRHDHDKVPMALLERDFVDPEHGEGRHCRPINRGINPAVQHPEHGIGQGVLFVTDIGNGAVDARDQQEALIRLRVGSLGGVPHQLLGRGGMIIAEGTAEALGADLNIHYRAEDRQVPQPDG